MNKVIIAKLGVEGGGITIYGSHSEGVWSYWTGGTSIDLDENDDEIWRSWSSEPVSSLELVVPNDWPLFFPSEIHPDFTEWFLKRYDEARAFLSADVHQSQENHQHEHWKRVLGIPI